MYRFDTTGQMTMLDLDTAERGGAPPKRRSGKPDSELVSIPYFHLDLLSSPVDLFGQRHWEFRSPWREGKRPLNTGAAPRRPIRVSLSGILEAYPSLKYYLSKTACLGILRRAFERGKELPKMLARALKIQAGLMKPDSQPTDLKAFHVNQRNEGIDLNGVSGALMATTNMQMQTSVTQPNGAAEGFDGYNGVMAFAANQRDEVRDLHDVAGVLGAQPGMKQQTFVAGFSAGAGACAGGIGYNESVAPTLKGSPGGNCMPSVLCLNDQGGSVMECSENVSGTLRAQEHGHQPLVYENHGIDSRYTGPHKVAPTISAAYGMGGNNTSLVEQNAGAICIAGNIVDRQPENGGNGLGCQEDLAYTLTATDRHAVVELYQKTVGALCRGDESGTASSRTPSSWTASGRHWRRTPAPPKNKKYIVRTAAEILGSGFALEEQNVYLPRKPESQAHAVALAAAGHRRDRHWRFALCAGADTGPRHGTAGGHGALRLPHHSGGWQQHSGLPAPCRLLSLSAATILRMEAGPMNREQKKELRQRQSTRQLMGIVRVTHHGIVTDSGERVFFLIQPDNLSVLSPEVIRGRVRSLTMLLSTQPSLEILALDSRESFQRNKEYYQRRLEEETEPAVRELLERDMAHLDAIQFSSASSRKFVLVLPLDEKAGADESTLRQLEKTICDHGLRVRLAEEQDVKRLLAIYYRQDLTTEVFRDFDGEEYVHG